LALVAVLLSPDTGRIFFLEELDTGLHPTRLHLLIQLIQQACRTQDVQVIGTTHNPALLAFLDEKARKDALLVYRTEAAPDSRVRRIAELPDIESVLAKQDLGRLHASGWLETAAVFSEPDEAGEGDEP
jgi:predicted ATPase